MSPSKSTAVDSTWFRIAALCLLAFAVISPSLSVELEMPNEEKFDAWTKPQLATVEREIQNCINKALNGLIHKVYDRKVKEIFCDPLAKGNMEVAFATTKQVRRVMPERIGNFVICMQKKFYLADIGSKIAWGLVYWWDTVRDALVGDKPDCKGMTELGISDDTKAERATTIFAPENFDPALKLEIVNLNSRAAKLIETHYGNRHAIRATDFYCMDDSQSKSESGGSEEFLSRTMRILTQQKRTDELKNSEKLLPIFNFVMSDDAVCKGGKSKMFEKLKATNPKACLAPMVALLSGDQERLRPLNKPDFVCSNLLTLQTKTTFPRFH